MDETDVRLIQMLFVNSRTPFRDMANQLEISVQAVHRRVLNLIDTGTIDRYRTIPSEGAWGAMNVFHYGRSEASSLEDVIEKLGENEFVYAVIVCSGNMVYVSSYMKNINDLSGLTDFFRRVAQVSDPQVALNPIMGGYVSKIPKNLEPLRELSYQELRIIGALHKDSRKPTSEVAKELNISPRTVNRNIEKMMEEKLIEFSISFRPYVEGDFITLMHVMLEDNTDKNLVIAQLIKKCGPSIIFFLPFTNLPEEVLAITWSKTTKDLDELQRKICDDDLVCSTNSNLVYRVDYFETWQDRGIFEKLQAFERKT
jgi:DNA-binding Lrp family transcriptional regulator